MILKILLTFLVLMASSWIHVKETRLFSSFLDDICEWIFIISFVGTIITALIYIWVSL